MRSGPRIERSSPSGYADAHLGLTATWAILRRRPDTRSFFVQQHQKETDAQIERLEKAFGLMDKPVSAGHCDAAEGLITEAEGYLDGEGNRDVLDAGIITAAQRFEHYEIASYGSAISFARQLNRNEVASLLQESLDEDKAAEEKLTTIAENGVNDAAMKAGR